MPVIQPAIRPPAEAGSFLLQITRGCSSGSCTFCGAYSGAPFRIKPEEEILADIRAAEPYADSVRRAFLMDGDALVLENRRLFPVLDRLHAAFPHLGRISAYANGYNITSRSDEELRALRNRGLSLIYMGLESGSQKILDRCRKRSTSEEMVKAVQRAAAAGIKSSVIVLLGLGGKNYSREHVRGTIDALNRMQPRYLSFLSLMLIPGTPLHTDAATGRFRELDRRELLLETRDILTGLQMRGTVFRSDHASNHLPLEGRLPDDRERLCAMIDDALSGKRSLRAEDMRGL